MCVCGGGGGGDEVGSFCEVVNFGPSFFGSSNSYNENHLWVIS